MDESDQKQLVETSGLVLSQSALWVTLFEMLKRRGLLAQADITEIVDLALVGIETAPIVHDAERQVARRSLEDLLGLIAERRGTDPKA